MKRFMPLVNINLLISVIMVWLPIDWLGLELIFIYFLLCGLLAGLMLWWSKKDHKPLTLFLLFLLSFGLFFKLGTLYDHSRFDINHTIVYAELKDKHIGSRPASPYLDFYYQDTMVSIGVNREDYHNDSLFKSVLLFISPIEEIIKTQVTEFEKRKFKYPVEYRNNLEYGNDSYDYCVIEPYTALNNFGLRRVTKSIENSDTILYYTTINDSINNQLYRCADTLQTQSNRALVGDSFAFLFHDGIYTKEQVFEEIPEAKEYYYKYYKESE